jgi:hypothetical protein
MSVWAMYLNYDVRMQSIIVVTNAGGQLQL